MPLQPLDTYPWCFAKPSPQLIYRQFPAGVCVCVFSLVTLWSCDYVTVWQPYRYMGYIGFVIHGKGQFCQLGVFPLGGMVRWVPSWCVCSRAFFSSCVASQFASFLATI